MNTNTRDVITISGSIKSVKDITVDTFNIKTINSIKHKYKHLRQASKAPTFALTYAGTYQTLMTNCGFTEDEAKHIESSYHELYKESDEYVKNRLDKASIDGYAEVAFGLRIRCYKMYQSFNNTRVTPKETEAERRTVGNALGQSYGLLNSRVGIDIINQINNSEYKYDILPCVHIHDASYYMVKDNLSTVKWLNDRLNKAVAWQEDPLIYHPQVHLSGKLSLFFPNESYEMEVPNYASVEEIKQLAKEHIKSIKEK